MEGVPPHDLEAEASVLGAVLVSNAVLTEINSLVDAEAFHNPRHKIVFRSMLDLFNRQEPIDVRITGVRVMSCSRQDDASTASLSNEIFLRHSRS